jgi:hypothetical protein
VDTWKGGMSVNRVDVFCTIYENRRMKPVEIVLRGKRENDRGGKSKIHCKHNCKYHNTYNYYM